MENIDNSQNKNIEYVSQKPYPNLSQSWELFGIFLLITLGLGFLAAPFSSEKFSSIQNWLSLITYFASFYLLFYYVNNKLKAKRLPLTLRFNKQPSYLVYLLLIIITPLISIVIEPLSAWIPMPDFFKDLLSGMVKPDLASFLTVVIAAPLCEEVICRGIILEGLLKNKMKPSEAIMWSAFIFAALHLNPWQGIPAFILGCFMGWAYYRTRSLWASIFIHFVNNGLAFLILVNIPDPDITAQEIFNESYLVVYLISLVLVAVLLYTLYSHFKSKEYETPNPDWDNSTPQNLNHQ